MNGRRAKALRQRALELAKELEVKPETQHGVITRTLKRLMAVGPDATGQPRKKLVDVERKQIVLMGVGRLYRMLKTLYKRGELNPMTERLAARLAFRQAGARHA